MLSYLRIILLVCFSTVASTAGAASLDDVVRQYRQSVIFIKVQKVNHTNGAITEESGTGFVVNKDGFVITSGHVVAGGSAFQVDVQGTPGSREGTPEGMEVLYESSNFDVAILRFKNTSIGRIPIPIGDPWAISNTATVYSMGFPGNEEWFHAEGRLSGNGPKGSWNTTLTLNPGMSGGPILNNEGKVVAMVWGGVPTPGIIGINRVLPVNLLIEPLRIAGIATSSNDIDPRDNSLRVKIIPRPANEIEVSYKIDRGQESLGGLNAVSKNYEESFQAKAGYKIVDHRFVARSSNNAEVISVQTSPDKKSLTVAFSLKSGPIFDRWRGWLDADVLTRQEAE